ncbi:hypothetical protein FSPOR_135 [Fusarium sporotrichioides]|uniref:Uncharacterized protein n=1 Tax=Fusarium sporotrichioides TaxID=5514 RepID=A0A395SVE5_FUSSP|nr:hypothetical protein FSPOR_135 [Fusarium sporotrichioides]
MTESQQKVLEKYSLQTFFLATRRNSSSKLVKAIKLKATPDYEQPTTLIAVEEVEIRRHNVHWIENKIRFVKHDFQLTSVYLAAILTMPLENLKGGWFKHQTGRTLNLYFGTIPSLVKRYISPVTKVPASYITADPSPHLGDLSRPSDNIDGRIRERDNYSAAEWPRLLPDHDDWDSPEHNDWDEVKQEVEVKRWVDDQLRYTEERRIQQQHVFLTQPSPEQSTDSSV